MLENLKDKRILVVGDFILDYYRHLDPIKVSPEAPIVVFTESLTEVRPGGAANVAANIASMGAKEVFLVGVVGQDFVGSEHIDLKSDKITPLLVEDDSRRTTIKERLVNKRHQVARIDTKKYGYVKNEEVRKKLFEYAMGNIGKVDAVVFSDYHHGALTYPLCVSVIKQALMEEKPIIVDTKSPDICKYHCSSVILPNNIEAQTLIDNYHPSDSEADLAKELKDRMNVGAVGMTLGDRGIMLYKHHPVIYPALDIGERALDATGAGDVVTASVSACLACGISVEDAMVVANIAAGISVTKWGTSIVPIEELEPAITKEFDNLKKEAKNA